MRILGISCFYHDAAAALLQDGHLIAAAQEERFSRLKHDPAFPVQAVRYCLAQGQIRAGDLDYVVFYEKPFAKFERILRTILDTFPRSRRVFLDALSAWIGEKLWISSAIQEHLGVRRDRILFCDHHHAHAASAFFSAPFDQSAILTIDAVGEWTTTAVGRGSGSWNGGGANTLSLDRELHFPHSLGLLYSAFTAFLGFEVNEGEYKVMGMAAFGEPRYVDEVKKMIRVAPDGSFALDMAYFSFDYHRTQMFSQKFIDVFGPPRDPRTRFATARTGAPEDAAPPSREEDASNQKYADIAASIQRVLEDILVRMGTRLALDTGLRKLCLAGGVALNSAANFRLLRETAFDELYIQPAAGDAGGALGAALYAYHVLLGKPRAFVMEHAAWGQAFDTGQAADVLRKAGMRFDVVDNRERLIARVVDALTAGKVVGWFQGRAEWGPRALGHRSILADPRRAEMRDTVNVKIKFREPFRPFAPSVLADRASEFFQLEAADRHWPTRFMLYVVPVRNPEAIPAVTHVDGTSRFQGVRRESEPLYARLLETFGQAAGIPMLLNTSFNLKGEPIVNSPEDAVHTFMRSDMDLLVIENTVAAKAR